MKATKIVSLLLVLVMLLGVLASCGNGDSGNVNGGVRGDDGSWDGVDFGGQTVRMALSINQYVECSFPAANIYTKGPDKAGSNEVAKGLIPTPKWDTYEQEEYHTIVHDQTEIGCILNTANAFSAASAYMQYLNEESDKVVYAYFEKGLKYKYNDDANSREMMDIVRESTDSPFDWQIGVLCQQLYTGTTPLHGMWIEESKTCASTFASEKDAYNDCVAKMIEKFAALQ